MTPEILITVAVLGILVGLMIFISRMK